MKDYIIIDTQAVVTIIEAHSPYEAIRIAREQGFKVAYIRETK